MCRAAGKELLIALVALQRLRSEKIVAGKIQRSTNVAYRQPKVEIVGEICAEPPRECLVVVRVPFDQAPRRNQFRWRYLYIARVIMSKIQIVVEPFQRSAHPGVLVQSTERATLETA